MSVLPRLTLLVIAAIMLAGCSAKPSVPKVGTTYVFGEDDGNRVTLTYKGKMENAGRAWHQFEQKGQFSFPIENLQYLDEKTGGKPDAPVPGYWEEDSVTPFMEWHRGSGKFSAKTSGYTHTIVISEDGKQRTVTVTTFHAEGPDKGDVGAKLKLTYDEGDIVPRTIHRQGAPSGEGTWRYDAFAERL